MIAKRIFDILIAASLLVLAGPAMGIIAIAIRRGFAGPAIYVQARLGRLEKTFACYKFRTMSVGAPVAGSHEVSASWITPIGKRLRAVKLDELPQLVNVLRGEMSLVGPRPCLPSQLDVIMARRKMGVFQIRPGLTGPAQLAGVDMSMPNQLAEVDRRYIDRRSFLGDLRILLETAAGKGQGDRTAA